MQSLLAINTISIYCSVALLIDNIIISEVLSKKPSNHSHVVIPIIDSILLEAGLSLDNISCIAFNINYGSFAGIRIGTSLAQGLAVYTRKALVNISTLENAVQTSWRYAVKNKILLVIKPNEEAFVYITKYQKINNSWLLKRWTRRINPNSDSFKTLTKGYVIVSNIDLLVYLGDNSFELKTKYKTMLLTAKSMLTIALYRFIKTAFLLPVQVISKQIYDINRKEYCIKYIHSFLNKQPL